jgi:hypothetical protein
MIEHVVIAILVACIVGLVCVFAGRMLKAAGVPFLVAAGGFLEQFAWGIGLIAGLWFYFGGPRL